MTVDHNTTADTSVFFDHHAERIVLGAMLLDAKVIGEVEAIVDTDSFHLPAHRVLFDALTRMRLANRPTDPVGVAAYLQEVGNLHKLPGDALYLHTLVAAVPTSMNGPHYAGIVADRALLRDLDEALGTVRAAIRAGGAGSPADLVERARTMVADLAARATGVGGPERWRDIIIPGMDAIEEAGNREDGPPGISTGFPDLDKVNHGLRPGQLIIVAGQPGGGKSTLAAGDWIRAAAFKQGIPTGLWTMEMTKLEMFNRLICAEAGVLADNVASGRMTDNDWVAVAKVAANTEDAPLWIDDTKGLTMADIRVRARRLHQQHGLGLAVIDYVGLIECRTNLPRNQQVDDLARQAKVLAGELGIPVVLLAQLNRNASNRSDKKPILTDLKESGGLEAHADQVIFVHRPEMYDDTQRVGEADLIVEKCRGGARQTIVVAAQLHLNRFVSMAIPERNAA